MAKNPLVHAQGVVEVRFNVRLIPMKRILIHRQIDVTK